MKIGLFWLMYNTLEEVLDHLCDNPEAITVMAPDFMIIFEKPFEAKISDIENRAQVFVGIKYPKKEIPCFALWDDGDDDAEGEDIARNEDIRKYYTWEEAQNILANYPMLQVMAIRIDGTMPLIRIETVIAHRDNSRIREFQITTI